MRKQLLLLLFLSILISCSQQGGRSWMVPVNIDPSDLVYTPAQMESFEARREALQVQLEEAYVILRSWDQDSHNRHEFRVNNNFYYLSGYDAPQTWMLITPEGEFLLSYPRQSIRQIIYDGGKIDQEQVKTLYRPDQLLLQDQMMILIDSILLSGSPVYTQLQDFELVHELQYRAGMDPGIDLRDVSGLVDELRVLKGQMEVERLQKACNITALALTRVMRECQAERYEFEMEAIIEGTYLEYGAAMPGFNSIVGSGPNSTTLHYEPNDRLMKDGDLLLMDVGAEYGYYTADITRTIPVNGTYSPEQQSIYQLVLDAQKAAIAHMKPGHSLKESREASDAVISRGLFELGLLTDTTAEWQSRFYTVHGISHYLGLYVHDVGSYQNHERILEPGMVLTIEPGVYIREKGLEEVYGMYGSEVDSSEIASFIQGIEGVFEQFKNIGVRIEDDVLITTEGHLVLSRYAPKEIADIEQIMH